VINGIEADSIQYFNFILVIKNGQKKWLNNKNFNILKKVSSRTRTIVTIENENNPDNSPSFLENMRVNKLN